MGKRFWISWNEPMGDDQDPRPSGQWPLPATIRKWWESGQAGDGSYATLCAVVDAADEDHAKEQITASWPAHGDWRFCEEKPIDWRPGDRFPWA